MSVRPLGRHSILVRLVIRAPLSVRSSITALVVSSLVLAHVGSIVRAVVVWVVVRVIMRLLLLSVRLGLAALSGLLLALSRRWVRRCVTTGLRIDSGCRAVPTLCVLHATLRVLVEAIALRSIVAAECALLLLSCLL